jgi:magnesium transporter
VIVDCAVYQDGRRQEGSLTLEEAAAACHRPGAFVWLGLFEPTKEEFADVEAKFGIHQLAAEDAIKAHQRPKLEVYDDTIFVVLRTAGYDDATESVQFGEIQVFIGEGFAIVVRHGEPSQLQETRKHLESRPELLELGPAVVLYSVVDKVVDDYLPVIAGIENDVREVELQVFSEKRENPVERIYKLKREVLQMDQATEALLEPLERLSSETLPWVMESARPYFRDVHDHAQRADRKINAFNSLLSSVLEANMTIVNVRQNEDMRKISAWVAIAAIPTLIGGVYGMNFEEIPLAEHEWGFWAAVVLMVVICMALYRQFRKSGWL